MALFWSRPCRKCRPISFTSSQHRDRTSTYIIYEHPWLNTSRGDVSCFDISSCPMKKFWKVLRINLRSGFEAIHPQNADSICPCYQKKWTSHSRASMSVRLFHIHFDAQLWTVRQLFARETRRSERNTVQKLQEWNTVQKLRRKPPIVGSQMQVIRKIVWNSTHQNCRARQNCGGSKTISNTISAY